MQTIIKGMRMEGFEFYRQIKELDPWKIASTKWKVHMLDHLHLCVEPVGEEARILDRGTKLKC